MECPVCLEKLFNSDILGCGHRIHKICVKYAVDLCQDDLVSEGYPARKYGSCPICRAKQPDIIACAPSWLGEISLSREELNLLLKSFIDNDYFISAEKIPSSIVEQMLFAECEQQVIFANTIASTIFMEGKSETPKRVYLEQVKPGSFSLRSIY